MYDVKKHGCRSCPFLHENQCRSDLRDKHHLTPSILKIRLFSFELISQETAQVLEK